MDRQDRVDEDGENSSLLKGRNAALNAESEDHGGCGATLACDPHRPLHRYLVLIIMCFLGFGSYFCYDNPAALQDTMERDMKLDTTRFTVFYSIYSWPNVILCFFGGFLIDRVLGVRWGGILFSSLITAGQVVFALGAFVNKYEIMCIGRFIFGLGGESLAVAQNTYAVGWFKGRELNMVFGLQLSISRVGSTVNMKVMQPLYDAVKMHIASGAGPVCLGVALFIAGFFCVMSLGCAFLMAWFDRRASRILRRDELTTGEVIKFGDIRYFPATYWLLCVICVTYYVAIFPFISISLVFFENKYQLDPSDATTVMTIPYILSAVLSPIFGLCIDKIGKNLFWVLAGVVFTIVAHALLAFSFLNPYVAMVLMGASYSVLASALWPLVAIVVEQHQIGTAYGIMQSIQNLGLAVVSILTGLIVDARGYLILELFFISCLCLALISTVVIYLVDSAKGGALNESAMSRRRNAVLESQVGDAPRT